MFDNNYDAKGGVSIWGHMTDGAATGAMGGALFGGVGAIPGAVAGGLVGLANGLWNSHEDSQGLDKFGAGRHDRQTESDAEAHAMAYLNQGMSVDEAAQQGVADVYHQQTAAQQATQETSWFDALF